MKKNLLALLLIAFSTVSFADIIVFPNSLVCQNYQCNMCTGPDGTGTCQPVANGWQTLGDPSDGVHNYLDDANDPVTLKMGMGTAMAGYDGDFGGMILVTPTVVSFTNTQQNNPNFKTDVTGTALACVGTVEQCEVYTN